MSPVRFASLVLLLSVAACSSSLPTPRTGPHPPNATSYMEVPYPPPAARVEIIPGKPRDGAVWVDGEWQWEGKVWVWEFGGWVLPPAGAYLAPWVTYRQENGKLLFAPGSWHADDGAPLPKPIVLAPAQSSLDPLPPEVPEDAAAPELPEASAVLPEASAVLLREARD